MIAIAAVLHMVLFLFSFCNRPITLHTKQTAVIYKLFNELLLKPVKLVHFLLLLQSCCCVYSCCCYCCSYCCCIHVVTARK